MVDKRGDTELNAKSVLGRRKASHVVDKKGPILHNITALNIASEQASKDDLCPELLQNELLSDISSHYGDGD